MTENELSYLITGITIGALIGMFLEAVVLAIGQM